MPITIMGLINWKLFILVNGAFLCACIFLRLDLIPPRGVVSPSPELYVLASFHITFHFTFHIFIESKGKTQQQNKTQDNRAA